MNSADFCSVWWRFLSCALVYQAVVAMQKCISRLKFLTSSYMTADVIIIEHWAPFDNNDIHCLMKTLYTALHWWLEYSLNVFVLGVVCVAGLTLTAASTVVFVELFWNPGVSKLQCINSICTPQQCTKSI